MVQPDVVRHKIEQELQSASMKFLAELFQAGFAAQCGRHFVLSYGVRRRSDVFGFEIRQNLAAGALQFGIRQSVRAGARARSPDTHEPDMRETVFLPLREL